MNRRDFLAAAAGVPFLQKTGSGGMTTSGKTVIPPVCVCVA